MKLKSSLVTGWSAKLYDWQQRFNCSWLMYQKILTMVELKTNDRLLDLGCGTGTILIELHKRYADCNVRLCGLDPSYDMIRIAKRKSRTANATIDFIVGNGNKIPFDKGYFDWVITSLTLHHVAKDWQEKLLAEAFRVLAPGGRLLIVDFGPPCSWLGRIVSVWFWRHAFTKDNLAGSVHQALQQSPWKNIRRVNVQLGLIEYIFATR